MDGVPFFVSLWCGSYLSPSKKEERIWVCRSMSVWLAVVCSNVVGCGVFGVVVFSSKSLRFGGMVWSGVPLWSVECVIWLCFVNATVMILCG